MALKHDISSQSFPSKGGHAAPGGSAPSSDDAPGAPTRDSGPVEGALQPSQALPLITEELAAAYTSAPVTRPNPPRSNRDLTAGHDTVVAPDGLVPPVVRATPTAPVAAAATDASQHATEDPAVYGSGRTDGDQDAGNEGADAQGTDDGDEEKKRKGEGGLSITQLLAGAGAAATSSVIGGQLGVAGTVMGAAAASIITAVAVTIYSKSLDKGKEKVKVVGSKLAPAVKVAPASIKDGKPLVSLVKGSTFRRPGTGTDGGSDVTARTASAGGAESITPAGGAESITSVEDSTTAEDEQEPRTWLQKLRRKRVLYPVAIGVATFGVGLGIVIAAESFTDADISPGTSQISRSVTGTSAADSGEVEDSGGAGSSGSGSTSGEDGSRVGEDPVRQQGSSGDRGSTSAGESGSGTGPEEQTSQGTDTGATTSDSTTTDGTSSDGTSTGTDSSSSSSSGSTDSGAQTGTSDGSSSSGSSSPSGGSGSGSDSGSASSGSGSGGSESGSQGSAVVGQGTTVTDEG